MGPYRKAIDRITHESCLNFSVQLLNFAMAVYYLSSSIIIIVGYSEAEI